MMHDQAVEQQRHQTGRQHPRRHQPLHRVDAQHLHRVDLFADRARAEVRAHRRRTGAGHDQHRHQRTDLGDRAERRTRTTEVRSAQFAQQDVEREADQNRERYRHQQRRSQRNARDEPGLLQELAPLERSAKDEPDRVRRHREQPTDGLHRPGEAARQTDARRPAVRPLLPCAPAPPVRPTPLSNNRHCAQSTAALAPVNFAAHPHCSGSRMPIG